MLTREDNEVVTRTGPGTPMGDVLRRYWIPASLARELPEPDCPPVRVQLLGERLVGFRDSQGRIGLVDEFCPHRRASLWFGRNEESGLRCIYHGWKFDVGDRRGYLDLYGAARADAGTAGFRMDPGAGDPSPRLQGMGGVQLAAGARRRHRHVACADPAPHDYAQHFPPGYPCAGSVCPRKGTHPRSRCYRLRLPLCWDTSARRRQDLCALLSFCHAVHPDPAAAARPRHGRRRSDEYRRPHLGPDRRRELYGMELDV